MTTFIFSNVLVGLGLVLLVLIGITCFFRVHPDLHCFPSCGRCRLCKKRIYIWRKSEYRIGHLQIIRPRSQPELIEERCLVHRSCKGDLSSQINFIERKSSSRFN